MNDSNQDMIDRFLDNKLSQEEREAFDRQVQENPELAQQLAFELNLRKAIQAEKQQEIRTKLDHVLPASKPVRPLYFTYGVAAAIVVLLAIAFGLNTFVSKEPGLIALEESTQEVSRIIERDAVEFNTMGTDGDLALLEQKYQQFMQRSQTEDPCAYLDLSYYAGVYSLFVLHDFQAAIKQLTCTATDTPYRADVWRLLVMAHCGAGEVDRAKALVEKYGVSVQALPGGIREKLRE